MITNITTRDYVQITLPSGTLDGYTIKGNVGFYDDWNGKKVIGFYTNDPNALFIPHHLLADYIRVRPDRRNPSRNVYKLRIHLDVVDKLELIEIIPFFPSTNR